MGHSQVAPPPATRRWREVVLLITFGAQAEEIAAATARVMEGALSAAPHDPAVRHAFWLLTQVPTAAKSGDFADSLRRSGILVGAAPTLLEICSALVEAVGRQVQSEKARTDFGELATVAAAESLNSVAAQEMPGLFGPTHAAEDTQVALAPPRVRRAPSTTWRSAQGRRRQRAAPSRRSITSSTSSRGGRTRATRFETLTS
jgi:hypothetical protein